MTVEYVEGEQDATGQLTPKSIPPQGYSPYFETQ